MVVPTATAIFLLMGTSGQWKGVDKSLRSCDCGSVALHCTNVGFERLSDMGVPPLQLTCWEFSA